MPAVSYDQIAAGLIPKMPKSRINNHQGRVDQDVERLADIGVHKVPCSFICLPVHSSGGADLRGLWSTQRGYD
jgi:hypothetical protein